MKRCILVGMCVILLLVFMGCTAEPAEITPETTVPEATVPEETVPEATVPEATDPEQSYDMVYDLWKYQWFSDILEEKPVDEWNALGRYKMLLKQSDTPVVLDMDGTSVLSICAYDQTVDLGTAGLATEYDDGYSPVYDIRSVQGAILVRMSDGEHSDRSILITEGGYFQYPNEIDGDILLSVRDDGAIGYCRTWLDPMVFEIEGYSALCYPTSRDMILSQCGKVMMEDGNLVFTAEETVILSDLFDLDTMFAEAKAEGWFEEYDTLDALLKANCEKG